MACAAGIWIDAVRKYAGSFREDPVCHKRISNVNDYEGFHSDTWKGKSIARLVEQLYEDTTAHCWLP